MAIPQPISKTCVTLERGSTRRCSPGMRSATATYKQAGGGHGQRERQRRERGLEREVADDAADHGGQAGQQVERQRAPARHARVQQHREVADFLRNLVRHDGERRDDAEVHVGEEGGGDQHAVEHVVQGVADQHQRAAGLAAAPGRADQCGRDA